MKQYYSLFFLSLMILASETMAQVTLYVSDAPQIDDQFINANDTTDTDTILSVSTGENQSWDFSWIRNDTQDTTDYVDPASTPNASTFPTATLAQSGQQGYTYLFTDQNHLEVIGGQMDTIAVIFKDPLTYFVFPLSYDTSFVDTGIMDITIAYDTTIDIGGQTVSIDSVRIKRTIILKDTVTGWGNLTNPLTTYNNVLQLKSNEVDIDSISVHTTGYLSIWMPIQNTTSTIDKWEWFTKYKKAALVSLEVSDDTIKKASYFLDPSMNIETQMMHNSTITISPNPANSIITLSSKKNVSYIEIYSITGVCIQTETINNKRVSIKQLSSGNYIIKSFDKRKKLLGTNKLIISK